MTIKNVPRGTSLRKEEQELITIFEWIDLHKDICNHFLHVPNEGKRSYYLGKILKRMGLRKGVSDILGLIPRGKYHGICIEHKTIEGKPTAEQLHFIDNQNAAGYFAKITYGVDDAIDTIRWYINL